MRVLQSMAGAQHGGAEAFFVRLVIALHKAGLEQRVVIRRNRDRAQHLSAAGIAPRQLRVGNALSVESGKSLAAASVSDSVTWGEGVTPAFLQLAS